MLLLRGHSRPPANWSGCVATIGNFDGVHLGHQALLQRLQQEGTRRQLPTLVVLFEPHPQEFFCSTERPAPARLLTLREKLACLREQGITAVQLLRFNSALASLAAEDFISVYLQQRLNVQHLVIGDDFRFGHQRRGDFAMLQAATSFSCEASATVVSDGERVSSTAVRQALASEQFARAARLLGRPYTFSGKVAHGDARGRLLGFPTANLRLHRRVLPLHGVFAVHVHGLGPKPLPGVANIGNRPTVGGTEPRCETHLLDFSGDLYGRQISVEPLRKLRGEQRFDGLDALRAQIARDAEQARQFFAGA
ncbi:bifunctional riboflavin kinase/FAD synthetase [Permianibacter sp. IMCC34836]|uniref:bifunctional riboflavin kinase/FAD synthetase n=1 Tax=Permianibacter fluminis TaxID=2738515 RepID=UPI001557F1F3|nr:bifunctional riboflavin kinase/FAD synthetase [Permianibacter fluminis]NQD37688.1 bifunctional riboflavin kinase/FAD synthetase [Permianibacter fluminis]